MTLRLALAVMLVVGYHLSTYTPAPKAAPIAAVAEAAAPLNPVERWALQRAYRTMSRIVVTDDSLVTSDDLRRFHRTGLSYVWEGVLGNKRGTRPALGEAIDSALNEALGTDATQIDQEYRTKAAKALLEVGDSI